MATGDLVDAKSIIGLLAARVALGWTSPAPPGTPRPAAEAGSTAPAQPSLGSTDMPLAGER
jgi:hypothetical protein